MVAAVGAAMLTHAQRCEALAAVRRIRDQDAEQKDAAHLASDCRVAFVVLADGRSVFDVVCVPPPYVDLYKRIASGIAGVPLVAMDVHGGTFIGGPTVRGDEYREPYRMMSDLGALSMPMALTGPMLWARSVWYAVIADGDWISDERWQPPGESDHYAPTPRDYHDGYNHAYAWRRLPAPLLRRKIREEVGDADFLRDLYDAESGYGGKGRKTVLAEIEKKVPDVVRSRGQTWGAGCVW